MCCITKMASNDRVTRVTIDCVETIIDGQPVILFNSPSPVEGREMICVPPTQNGNYRFLYVPTLYLPPHGFNVIDKLVSSHYSSRFNSTIL